MTLRALAVAVVAVAACTKPPEPPPVAPVVKEVKKTFDRLERGEFNRRAQQAHQPLFWRADDDGDRALSPGELSVLWTDVGLSRAELVDAKGAFTERFVKAYEQLVDWKPCAGREGDALKRCELNVQELDQGRPTLVETDLGALSEQDRAVIAHLAKAAVSVERLYARQKGTFGLAEKVPGDDFPARAVFWRNQGPRCEAPKTDKEPLCGALAEAPAVSGLYPAALQGTKGFCQALEKDKNAKALTDHFTVVAQDEKGALAAVPYSKAWADDMQAVASELDEAAFKKYLADAANAFRTNDWETANVSWVAMGPDNSKWFLRAAPDEVYEEPCGWKAGFALVLARIDPSAVEWQKKLSPVKQDLEATLAKLAGKPYAARKVAFKLPDFINIVLNAGDARPPSGATAGQSLPNWGKTAEKGGRTMVMANLYTDQDSRDGLLAQTASLFCPATQKLASADPAVAMMGVVLHEAAHNLGPSHDYKAKGKTDDQAFGGPLAATLEELKAQTSALFLMNYLADKKLITEEEATRGLVRQVAWAFGHISRGMYTSDGKPKNYSQLASIQLHALKEAGALIWQNEGQAANGTDVGCFEVDPAKAKAAVLALETKVLQVKAQGDKAGAEKLKAAAVDAKDEWASLRVAITERWLRAPKATFVYALKP